MACSRPAKSSDLGAIGAGLIIATQAPGLATLSVAIVLGLVTVLALTSGLATRGSRRDGALRVLVVLLDFLRHHRRVDNAHYKCTTRTIDGKDAASET
jgi:hypothetical protein